ncbi:MAG: O-antigen ligase family protein [Patescibacteria group bacterium]|nr:hypothetical protein [Patescibacteria group bacterium]
MAFSLNFSDLKNPTKLAEILLCLAVFTLPLQIFTIIDQPSLHLSGQLNQFRNATIYVTDILILLSALFSLPRFFKTKIQIGDKKVAIPLIILAVLLLLQTSFSIPWTILRLTIFAIFYLLIINKIIAPEKAVRVFLASAAIQAIIASAQFITQQELGLGLLGEPSLQSEGIAKIDIGDSKVARGYGTMPHPNVLGGLLVIAIILGANLKKSLPLIAICAIGLIFTFSRSAGLTLALVALTYLVFNSKTSIKFIKKYSVVTAILLIIAIAAGKSTLSHLVSTHEITERLAQFGPTIDMIEDNPLGVGWQNFTLEIQNYTEAKLAPWEIQPVHNIYLLSAAELSRLGLVLMVFIMFYLLFYGPRKNLKYAIAAIMIIGLFDHYFYTLYQGQMMVLTVLAISARE